LTPPRIQARYAHAHIGLFLLWGHLDVPVLINLRRQIEHLILLIARYWFQRFSKHDSVLKLDQSDYVANMTGSINYANNGDFE
jgi:hypothetical protein